MTSNHPIRRAVVVLRVWLFVVATFMILNANTATAYVLSEDLRPLPFYFLAVVALAWSLRAWDWRVVATSSVILTIGSFLRGLEVLLFADQYDLSQRMTGMSLWWFVSASMISFGVVSLIVASKKEAEEWVWKELSRS